MIALLASFLISTNAPAAELVKTCRAMIPPEVRLEGRIILRNRKGIVKQEHAYVLGRTNGVSRLTIDGVQYNSPAAQPATADDFKATLLGTDVVWSDLTLDYLWWSDVADDAERTGESIHGQRCRVIDLKNGNRLVKAWIDCKTGALMQAEEYAEGKAVRRLWGTRVRKFGDRWMANVMEVETLGSGHRTKITVEKLDNER